MMLGSPMCTPQGAESTAWLIATLSMLRKFSQRIRLNILIIMTIIVLFLLNCRAFDHCMMLPTYGGYSFPQLNKLENATYARSHSFMGKSVDVYSYDVSSKN